MSRLHRALILVLVVSLIATTLSFASNGKRKRLGDRVDDLEKAVNNLQERVAALEGKSEEEKAGDPFEACRQWGKDNGYVNKMTSDYRVFKDAGLREDEILKSSLDACRDRVTNPDQLPVCRACMTAIVRELFKD